MENTPFRRALISVYDKTGLLPLAQSLRNSGCEIIASGGTAKLLRHAGIEVRTVESITGAEEILGGRVKTLHPAIHGAILARLSESGHQRDLAANHITAIDLVVVNLYPFEATLNRGGTETELVEEIDIGGVALLRAAAKNFERVTVISHPDEYSTVIEKVNSGFSTEERRGLAAKAFAHTREYDAAIASWLDPKYLTIIGEKVSDLRYGENPHQSAALFVTRNRGGIAGAEQLSGKAMSFNNYLDADAAFRAVQDHQGVAVAIIKHTNPCGIAVADNVVTAYEKALECDRVSAFGGVVATNSTITTAMANAMTQVFTEVVIAPSFEEDALRILGGNVSLRVIQLDANNKNFRESRAVSGGFLLQDIDQYQGTGDDSKNWTLVAGEQISDVMMQDLEFAWRSVRSVRSNAILIARDLASVGIGMGQVNRVNSARLAVSAAGKLAMGAVAASDAFFPFSDGLKVLIDAGVKAVVQPGGSKRDEEVIATARAHGVSMYLTGTRHFSHS
jgi:phosphoribosylaminoimidazolecarboxamide formyltransferase/IMP cyclohydrolase